ncbi:MAG: hypothetical protein RIT04_384 [Candidatus Parcubacteria bacterium]
MAINTKKYISVFFITCVIFIIAFMVSDYFSNIKVANIKNTQDKISIDILSNETEFALLQEASCESMKNTTISDELNTLGERLSYAEQQQGISNDDVITLKKYYSLLEIKDSLLMKKVYEKCAVRPVSILYFYSNKDCPDCKSQGNVLTAIRQDHPEVRVYTFDYNLDLNAMKTLLSIHKIKPPLPVIIINDKVYSGLQTIEAITKVIPSLAQPASSTVATSTKLQK